MPRPGPRPYECVRRAWHSDRHKPMRGSIIQQIFRVVIEAHSAATKKNKEWQEKLPIVVFKAEEIMYSKANSEAEYMNPDTLWDRVNDAINTIIRRDESSETGELLPPCIEAALNLGCIPVRASRSQRHSNPRSYLSPRVQETTSAAPIVLDKPNDDQCPQLLPLHFSNQLNFARATTTMNTTFPVSVSNRHQTENSNIAAPHSYNFRYENIPPGCSQSMTKETNKQLNLGSVYPLYYGNQYHTEQSQLVSQVPEKTNSNTIFVGKPIGTSVAEPAEMGVLPNFFSCSSPEIASKRSTQADFRNTNERPPGMQCDLSSSEIASKRITQADFRNNEKPPGMQCDLSLRLGLLSDPGMSVERNSAQQTVDVGSSSCQDRGKSSDISLQQNKEFCFFPGRSSNDPVESCSIKWFSDGEDQNLGATIRKRKAPFSSNVEDGQFC